MALTRFPLDPQRILQVKPDGCAALEAEALCEVYAPQSEGIVQTATGVQAGIGDVPVNERPEVHQLGRERGVCFVPVHFRSHLGSAKVDVKFEPRIGVAVPRDVTLFDIPEDVVIIIPEWRRYKYVLIGDEICIVDLDTYEIVEVVQAKWENVTYRSINLH